MITLKALAQNGFLAAALSFPQLLSAQSFTAAGLLEWTEEQQDGYFQTSVLMVGIVAAQMERNAHIADCIDNWHGEGPDADEARAGQIREAMKGLPEYHPQAVILAVIQKECGKFQ